jgi:subtilisin family serine protease
MKRSLIVAMAAGLAMVALPARAQDQGAKGHDAPAAQPGARKPVKTQDDLPRHTYTIQGKASEFLMSDAPFKAFVAKVKADTEDDLAKYDIQDPTTLQGYYSVLQQIAIFEGRDDDAIALISKVRSLEGKESKKLMTGQTIQAFVAAKKAGADQAAIDKSFRAALDKNVRSLPYQTVAEELKGAKGRAQIISRELILGSLQGQLDPVIEAQKGELSGDLARGLIGARVTLDFLIPLQPAVADVYGKIISDNEAAKVAAKDIWTPSQVTLTEADKASPVVVGVWDSGTDVSLFPKQLYVNAKEAVNGKDDDGNGFVDDVNGIAFDLDSNATPELLHSTSGLTGDLKVVTKYTKGFMDLQSNVDSPEAADLRKHITSLNKDQVTPFMEDLQLYGNYSHGTHVAGIAAAGNPYARLLPARITFDYHTIPTKTPSIEDAKKEAQAGIRTIEYFKQAGVRVVNMSWGGSRSGIESTLEMKVPGMKPEERAALSREIFKIGKDALEQAMKNAPEILFVVAAGNDDNDNEFSEVLPSGLSLPNMITVGAIDSSGKPTGFTTFGKNVTLYANGFEVESYVPGGEKMKFSGTSMAAPNAANLAAKILAVNPRLTTQQVIELINQGADPMEGHQGRFILNPKKTIELAKKKS